MAPIVITPVTLEGRWVRLEPLRLDHLPALSEVAVDEEIWRYMPLSAASEEALRRWAEEALHNATTGSELPFATLERQSGRPIGSTRFMDIRPPHRGAEIGYTWLGRPWWRTRINSEAKYLMLRHLFEEVSYIRVSLKTDLLNTRSQRAIERLGAQREGVLRKHMIVQDGRERDTVYYSILDIEWPGIKQRMEESLYGEGRDPLTAPAKGSPEGSHGS